jgi:hypothetical protein
MSAGRESLAPAGEPTRHRSTGRDPIGRPMTSQRGTDLARAFSRIARELADKPTVGATLEETVRLAVEVVPGCEYAGVSWLAAGRHMETPACTDPLVAQCDAAQYRYREGPCVDAVWEEELNQVDDLRTDPRWPRFARVATDLGMRSMLACRLAAPHRTIGALNLYATTPNAFDEHSRALVLIYAAHASIALVSRRLESDLRTAVDTRGTIGQAIGILIERHRLQPAAAFDVLVRASQERQVKLRELAEELISTGSEELAGIDAAAVTDASRNGAADTPPAAADGRGG